MRAVHILSHNAVVVKDAKKRNCVVIGKGIGYMKKVGDQINRNKIQNIFIETNYQNFREGNLTGLRGVTHV